MFIEHNEVKRRGTGAWYINVTSHVMRTSRALQNGNALCQKDNKKSEYMCRGAGGLEREAGTNLVTLKVQCFVNDSYSGNSCVGSESLCKWNISQLAKHKLRVYLGVRARVRSKVG